MRLTTYRIKDWDKRYENNRTRELKKLDWLPIPNGHDSDGYSMVAEHKNGPALYGAWVVILQVASRCGERGTLLRGNGKPHDSSSLSRMTRFPESLIKEALAFFSSEDIGWLEISVSVDDGDASENPAPDCGSGSHDPAPPCGKVPKKGREWKGIEEKGTAPPPVDKNQDAKDLIKTINELSGRNYTFTESYMASINARLAEVGGDVPGVKSMLSRQWSRWGSDPRMRDHFNPETLFRQSKFPKYYAIKGETPVSSGQSDPRAALSAIEDAISGHVCNKNSTSYWRDQPVVTEPSPEKRAEYESLRARRAELQRQLGGVE